MLLPLLCLRLLLETVYVGQLRATRRSGGSFFSYFQTLSIGRFPDQYAGSIDFITVLEAIFMGILCQIIFLKRLFWKEMCIVNLIFTAKACSNKLGAAPVVKFSWSIVVDFPYICLQFFREIEVGRNQEKYLHTIALKINGF